MRFAKFGEHLVDIGVRLDIEIDGDGGLAVVGVGRVHVVHVVDAAELLFDRSGDGLFESLRVRAGINGLNLNFRRNDVRELRGRQAKHGDDADNHHQDGDDHGHDGPVYEEFSHGYLLPSCVLSCTGLTGAPSPTF